MIIYIKIKNKSISNLKTFHRNNQKMRLSIESLSFSNYKNQIAKIVIPIFLNKQAFLKVKFLLYQSSGYNFQLK
jgi:hypothetical protein